MEKILTTKNYNDFTFFKGNREVVSSRVKELAESIKKHGLINPIVVNQNMEIIDGQHRKEACLFLQVPLRYTIHNVDGSKLLDLVRDINSVQKNWNNLDIGRAFTLHSANKKDYQRYLELYELKVPHSLILECAVFLNNTDKVDANNIYHDFKIGKLKLPEYVYEISKSFINLLYHSSLDPKVWKRVTFIRALLRLNRQDDFSLYTFIDQYEKYPQQWVNAYSVEENGRSIIHIHNHRRKQKAKFYIV
jgi:hypothetical protein|tara:strand:- start:868 stop:1611 length:744 start_codon:yes stop_codon:yes gene_type:complete